MNFFLPRHLQRRQRGRFGVSAPKEPLPKRAQSPKYTVVAFDLGWITDEGEISRGDLQLSMHLHDGDLSDAYAAMVEQRRIMRLFIQKYAEDTEAWKHATIGCRIVCGKTGVPIAGDFLR